MTKWEYLEVTVQERNNLDISIVANETLVFNDPKKPSHLFVYFDQLGKDGWELVLRHFNKFYFKRPLESVK